MTVILTQSWTDLQINPILEITVFIRKAGSGYFQRYTWKLAVVTYDVMLVVDKIVTGSGFQTNVSVCVKTPNL